MGTKTEKQGDFKKILKRLLVEKKQDSEESQEELFHAKIEKLQNVAFEEEIVDLKTGLVESEAQNQILLQQLEKTKITFQKINQECALLQDKIHRLEEEAKVEEKRRQEQQVEMALLQEQREKELEKWSQERLLFEKKQTKRHSQLNELVDEREILQESYEKLEKVFKQNQRHFREENESCLSEITRLQEKLAATEHQLKQTDLAKVHEEYEQSILQIKTDKELLLHELTHVKQSALLALENKEKILQEKIQEGHQVIQAWSEKCQRLEEERVHFKKHWEEKEEEWSEKEAMIVTLQKENKRLLLTLEEYEGEVQKAQLHLAKKVKESAFLQDVAYKQKEQIVEAQKQWSRENERRILLEKNVDEYQEKEDQLKFYAQQCNQEAQIVIDELTRTSTLLQQEKEKERARGDELEKYKEAYEKLISTLKELN